MTKPIAFLEETISPGLSRSWELYSIIHAVRTKYQDVVVAETAHGTTLFCERERQSSELTERLYHEGQIVPAMLLAPRDTNKALVLGSSEGVVCQILQEAEFDQIDHVDIDEECVRLCAKHLPYGYTEEDIADYLDRSAGFNLQLHFADGFQFVRDTRERYDIIAMDLPDENAEDEDYQVNRLYGPFFLSQIAGTLSPSGVFITNAGNSSYWRNTTLKKMWARMQDVFRSVFYFELEEQDWVWMMGTNQVLERQTAQIAMVTSLIECPYRPKHIDELTIQKALIPCHSLRI